MRKVVDMPHPSKLNPEQSLGSDCLIELAHYTLIKPDISFY